MKEVLPRREAALAVRFILGENYKDLYFGAKYFSGVQRKMELYQYIYRGEHQK